MKKLFTAVVFLALSLQGATAAIPAPPDPPRLVNDFAGVFQPAERDSLEAVLVAFDDSTSNQICVVTVTSLDGYEVSEYAVKLAQSWGIGSSKNNGVLVLMKSRAEDGWIDVSIQIGKGLEGAIPDVYASRIIRNIMGPRLSNGWDDYYTAAALACEELMKLASGEISEPRDRSDSSPDKEEELFEMILMTIVIGLIVLSIVRRWKKLSKGGNGGSGGGDDSYTGSGWGGGSYGGWGSWDDSSGSSSSGGGFGGFGGGSFGGGGASGRF